MNKIHNVTDTEGSASVLGALSTAALLAGCGGGGGGGASSSAPTPTPVPLTDVDAVRFLTQAGFSASVEDIAAVKSQGYAAWLDQQLALPVQTSGRVEWIRDNFPEAIQQFPASINQEQQRILLNTTYFNSANWCKLIASPDQVRQRMTLALSEIFVCSFQGLAGPRYKSMLMAHYADLLERGAFGTYRELLSAVTLSPAMGLYLNMRGNKKADGTGRMPDENYAREIMQLFSIGLVMLNIDGTPKLDVNGKPIPTYTQADITELAKVFTGWDLDLQPSPRDWVAYPNGLGVRDYQYVRREMAHNPENSEPGKKTIFKGTELEFVIEAGSGGRQALSTVFAKLEAHPNVAPFIGRQLIQRFVKSHPSREYVARVASAFNDNGRGVRGDLKATLRAVLLDEEAITAPSATDNASGRLREPVHRFIQWARTFGVTSKDKKWPFGDTSSSAGTLGQSPFNSPTVFNFFRPGYVPPGNKLAENKVTVPELQLCNETTAAAYLNFIQGVITNGMASGNMMPDYANELTLAADSGALLRHLNVRLAAGAINNTRLDMLIRAVNTIPATTVAGKPNLNRVHAAVLLVMAAPEYLVQK